MKNMSVIRYIGGKSRIAGKIAEILQASEADTLVDVFGGSGAVIMNSGFEKRIYNDLDGDLVNLFRVLADNHLRPIFLRGLRWFPPSREIYDEYYRLYSQNGFSFSGIENPIDRARATFFRGQFCFAGKMRSGGFAVSILGRSYAKEAHRFQAVLRNIATIGAFWRNTIIECMDFRDIVRIYGNHKNVVLFCDPPYSGTENYYTVKFHRGDLWDLSNALVSMKAKAVCTFYEHPDVREMFPEKHWEYKTICSTKNSQKHIGHHKIKVDELVLVKRGEK